MSAAPVGPDQQSQLFAALKTILGPVIGAAIEEIAAVADFELSEEAARPFVEFVHWINTRPDFIARWRSNPASDIREYPRFMTVTDGARSAYAAACYHLGRLKQIECAVNSVPITLRLLKTDCIQ